MEPTLVEGTLPFELWVPGLYLEQETHQYLLLNPDGLICSLLYSDRRDHRLDLNRPIKVLTFSDIDREPCQSDYAVAQNFKGYINRGYPLVVKENEEKYPKDFPINKATYHKYCTQPRWIPGMYFWYDAHKIPCIITSPPICRIRTASHFEEESNDNLNDPVYGGSIQERGRALTFTDLEMEPKGLFYRQGYKDTIGDIGFATDVYPADLNDFPLHIDVYSHYNKETKEAIKAAAETEIEPEKRIAKDLLPPEPQKDKLASYRHLLNLYVPVQQEIEDPIKALKEFEEYLVRTCNQ